MTKPLKSARINRLVFSFKVVLPLLLLSLAILQLGSGLWSTFDYQLLDQYYQLALEEGHGPEPVWSENGDQDHSTKVQYLLVDDNTPAYRMRLNNNALDSDRLFYAKLNAALQKLQPKSVAYDIIFRYPRGAEDTRLTDSFNDLEPNLFMPAAFELSLASSHAEEMCNKLKEATDGPLLTLCRDHLKKLDETQHGLPYHVGRVVLPTNMIFSTAGYTGHITAIPDADGVYRHNLLIIKVGDRFLPTMALSIYLSHIGVQFENIKVAWGEHLEIPRENDTILKVPIDQHGRFYVPYLGLSSKDAWDPIQALPAQKFLDDASKSNRTKLEERFKDSLVLVGDNSTGVADIGQTTLGVEESLIKLHGATLNALLSQHFYPRASNLSAFLCLIVLCIVLVTATSILPPWCSYVTALGCLVTPLVITWFSMVSGWLFPVGSITGAMTFIVAGHFLSLMWKTTKENTFINDAFGKYLSPRVVHELKRNPTLLSLGGETRHLSILFSDIAGFTTISERLSPEELSRLINEYLTEMTQVILEEDGIIDKYQGDAIMAEFGAPIPNPIHADQAARSALRMQKRLRELRGEWESKGLPELTCRIGINTGDVILGNMGSSAVFDYTVLGDAVNLAARLEGANKLYGSGIMISESTLSALTPGVFVTRPLDLIKVKGKSAAVKVYELCGLTESTISPTDASYNKAYTDGFHAYLEKRFSEAEAAFLTALQFRSNDPAADMMLARARELKATPLPSDWDGSVALTSK